MKIWIIWQELQRQASPRKELKERNLGVWDTIEEMDISSVKSKKKKKRKENRTRSCDGEGLKREIKRDYVKNRAYENSK